MVCKPINITAPLQKVNRSGLHLATRCTILHVAFDCLVHPFRRPHAAMPIMTRMRESMPVILFGLLIAFLITIIFEWGMDYLGMSGSRAEVVGSVNGADISYREFSEMLKNVTDNQKAQSGQEPTDDQVRQARDQVWETLVTQHLVQEQITRLGLTVTDQEIVDWVRGDNPPEDLRRNFVDSTGQFRRDIYDQFLANPNQFIRDPDGNDPAYGTRWLADYEKSLRLRRSQEKLQSTLFASVRATEGEMLRRFLEQNQRFEAAFAYFDPVALVPDSAVTITENDLRAYYEDHLEQYKVPAGRTISYVLLRELPSADDTAARREEAEDVARQARAGADFIGLTATYADRPDSGTFVRHGELAADVEAALFRARPGDVVGPVAEPSGFRVMKVLGERTGTQEYVHASHILLAPGQGAETTAVRATAQRIAAEARRGADFAALARTHSTDATTGQRGGDLGWFARGRMVKPFEDAVFSARPGEVAGPVRTQFGWHIVKVHARDRRELNVSSITVPLTPSSRTRSEIFQRAQDFSFNAGEGDFAKEAASVGLEVQDAQLQENAGVIPGLGAHEGLTRWSFRSDVGDVSEPFSVSGGYAVVTLKEIRKEGARPLAELTESLRPLVLRQKKVKRVTAIATEARALLSDGDSLTRLATLRPDVRVQATGPFTASGTVPGVGRDPQFIGAVTGLRPGAVSPAVESVRGAYLIQLFSRSEPDTAAFRMQREGLRTQIVQEKRNRFFTDWLAKLKEDADITDRREFFFR